MLLPRAVRSAMTTRRWASRRAAPGSRSSVISAKWAATARTKSSRWSVSATCRVTCSATACCARRRPACWPPSTIATSSSIPILTRPSRIAERERIFKLWRARPGPITTSRLISPGGGIYPRDAKTIALSPEACSALGVPADPLTPPELIRHLLCAEVDLLWFGGIGTYVKSVGRDPCRGRRPRQRGLCASMAAICAAR